MNLHASSDASPLVRAGLDTLLFLHIAGGSMGILSGAVALIAPKGETVHRVAGTVFFVSMLTMTGVAFLVAPFMGSAVNTIAGLLAFYLVASAWLTVKRKEGTIGRTEKFAVAAPIVASIMGVIFIAQAMNSPTGTIDDAPPQALYGFLAFGLLAAGSDLKVILRGGISDAARIARHLWRMCLAMFVATGSFFLGQQQVMPGFLHDSPWLFVPAFAPLVLLFYWLIRVRLTNWFTQPVAT